MELIRAGERKNLMDPAKGSVERYPLEGRQETLHHWDWNLFNEKYKWPGAKPHKHDDFEEFWFIVEGKARVYNSGEWHDVSAGDMVIHKPGELHMMDADEHCRWVCFSGFGKAG